MRILFSALMHSQTYVQGHRVKGFFKWFKEAFWYDTPNSVACEFGAIHRAQMSSYRGLNRLAKTQMAVEYSDRISFTYWFKTAKANGASFWYALNVALWYGVFARVEPEGGMS